MRAVPLRTMPQPWLVPTMVRGAGRGMGAAFGAARDMQLRSRWSKPADARASSAAMARAAISPEAQDGAPGQATMRRRGSRASTMKPRRSAAFRVATAFASLSRPEQERAVRRGPHPVSAMRLRNIGQLDQRIGLARGRRRGRDRARRCCSLEDAAQSARRGGVPANGSAGSMSSGRSRSAPIPLLRARSRARASGPSAAIDARRRIAASTASPCATRPSGVAEAASPASATCSIGPLGVATARNLMSAASASRWSAPPPSTTTETFGASMSLLSAMARRKSAARASASISEAGSPGSGSGDHRHAVAKIDVERGDGRGEQRRRMRREPAHLQAPPRADLDDAVAVLPRRGAEAGEVHRAESALR